MNRNGVPLRGTPLIQKYVFSLLLYVIFTSVSLKFVCGDLLAAALRYRNIPGIVHKIALLPYMVSFWPLNMR